MQLRRAAAPGHRDLPNVGYATVFPLAMITKIVLAQLIIKLIP